MNSEPANCFVFIFQELYKTKCRYDGNPRPIASVFISVFVRCESFQLLRQAACHLHQISQICIVLRNKISLQPIPNFLSFFECLINTLVCIHSYIGKLPDILPAFSEFQTKGKGRFLSEVGLIVP